MNPTARFINLNNAKATPSPKYGEVKDLRAPEKPFCQHLDDLYFRDQGTKKPQLTKPQEGVRKMTSAIGTIDQVRSNELQNERSVFTLQIHNADDTGLFGYAHDRSSFEIDRLIGLHVWSFLNE